MGSFQPRFPEIRYAIGRLVIDRANALDLTRRDLVACLGFKGREAKGHQMLTAFMGGENLRVPFLEQLRAVLEIDQEMLDAALAATIRELDAEAAIRALDVEQEYRSGFRPHLKVRCERRVPSPIFAAAIIGVRNLRIVELPTDVTSLTERERDEIAREAILQHFSTNRGWIQCFGKMEGYFLVLVAGFVHQDFGIPYDCEGHRNGSMTTVPRLPDARLGVRRADGRLTNLFRAGRSV